MRYGIPDGDKKDRVYFARSNGGIFWGKKVKTWPCQKYSFERSRYFFLDVNKPLGLQITQGSESYVSHKEIRSSCNR